MRISASQAYCEEATLPQDGRPQKWPRPSVRTTDRDRLARECAKLDPAEEQAVAEESAEHDLESWPEY